LRHADKNLKRKQDKSTKLEQRKKKRSAKAEKRAVKAAGAVSAEPKEVVGGKPRKSKTVAKKTVNASKRKEKLKARAEKLQEKANLLLAEAKKAAAQYQALLDAEVSSPIPWLFIYALIPLTRKPPTSPSLSRTTIPLLIPIVQILVPIAHLRMREVLQWPSSRPKFLQTSQPTRS